MIADKLRKLAGEMEANELTNNPGNWNLLLHVADQLEREIPATLTEIVDKIRTWNNGWVISDEEAAQLIQSYCDQEAVRFADMAGERYDCLEREQEKDVEIQSLTAEVEKLKNDLRDALDLKHGNGPTA